MYILTYPANSLWSSEGTPGIVTSFVRTLSISYSHYTAAKCPHYSSPILGMGTYTGATRQFLVITSWQQPRSAAITKRVASNTRPATSQLYCYMYMHTYQQWGQFVSGKNTVGGSLVRTHVAVIALVPGDGPLPTYMYVQKYPLQTNLTPACTVVSRVSAISVYAPTPQV